jgi:hypothetical protein
MITNIIGQMRPIAAPKFANLDRVQSLKEGMYAR